MSSGRLLPEEGGRTSGSAGTQRFGRAPPLSPLTYLSSDAPSFRTLIQWLISAVRMSWAHGARSIDSAPLALPVQLLLRLTAPVSLPHATATLVLATLVALTHQRPDEAAPLLARLINAPGPNGDRWFELLPGDATYSLHEVADEAVVRLSASRVRTFAQADAVQRAHGEVRDLQAVAVVEWSSSLCGVIAALVHRLGDLRVEAELTRSASQEPIPSLSLQPAPPAALPALARRASSLFFTSSAFPSVSAWLSECERRAERGWRKMMRSLAHETCLCLGPLLAVDAAAVSTAGTISASTLSWARRATRCSRY